MRTGHGTVYISLKKSVSLYFDSPRKPLKVITYYQRGLSVQLAEDGLQHW